MPPVIDRDKCIKCGKCAEICDGDVFYDSKKGEILVIAYPDECWHEGSCIQSCPVKGAIRLKLRYL